MKAACLQKLLGIFAAGLLAASASAQVVIADFEYEEDWQFYNDWSAFSAIISLSDNVAAGSPGVRSLRVDRFFGPNPWETEILTGPVLGTPLSISPAQYVTLRISGDPAFTNATFQTLFVYAFDGNGNFGRWGTPVPTSTNWQVFNLLASGIGQPWDSPGLPDLNNLTQFKIYIYGQGDPPGLGFFATLHVDDLMVRDTPLIEFPPPAAPRAVIDDFEGYADDAALLGFYSYQNSPAATATTASLASPAPQGQQALQLDIDFAPGQYPWGSVRSGVVAPFSFPPNAVVTVRFKGDPSLAEIADAGTTFWLSFYDEAGRGINFSTPAAPVISSEWVTLTAGFNQFWTGATVDTGNLVQWRILVEGWMGTPDSPARSGSFQVDDIRMAIPPELSLSWEGNELHLRMDRLIPGGTYELRSTQNFSQWNSVEVFEATATSATRTIPTSDPSAFYQVVTP